MPDDPLGRRIVDKMLSGDTFSRWLGVEIVAVTRTRVVGRATVRRDMLNSHQTLHGGLTFALADTVFGFAGNVAGRKAVSMEGNISFTRPVREGDVLTVTAEQVSEGNRIAVYTVLIANQRGEAVASFRGNVYRLDEFHFPGEGA